MSPAPIAALELDDIQGMALRAYRFPFGRHHLFRLAEAGAARAWLGRIAGQVATVAAVDREPDHTLNLALSWQGLMALGLPEQSLQSFPEAFRQGMAARAARLGDTGGNAPEHWDAPFGSGDAHLLATISAATAEARSGAAEALLASLPPAGLDLIDSLDVALLPGPDGRPVPVEHFGYRDGIGQPSIEGSGIDAIRGQGTAGAGGAWRPLKPGEFVLGQPDETGEIAAGPQPEALGRNGTYLVLRKLHQHVARFRAFLRTSAADAAEEELLAARLMGRWRSGTPLAVSPGGDDPAAAADAARNNDFSYAEDLKGVACPLGAHIRRMNPRAGLSGPAGASVNRHRVLRQGLPYGTALPAGAIADDGAGRGAVIILINADIARQFEFVQKVWTNDGDFAGLGGEKDPIIGANDGTGSFTIPRSGQPRRRIPSLPAFVSTRGGEYFFLPGIRALHHLASAGPPMPHPTPEAPP
ncbi:hypothetical protein [Siccirubricoccus sp. G192]|uniref:Dyp-type peroxidase n=1 Tax=Siccirubricoccus sp. G192 TaxID=2849651 RepID=UPI001C2C8FBC|nr:hypothetical protein [Siccirubricoccus sp. G192]MBV1796109.1 hypothetical protein [Siccirubricoccus sp. G192]